MMLSLGGLFLSLSFRVRSIKPSLQARDKAIRANLEEIAMKMARKHDDLVAHLNEVVGEFDKRIYR